MMTRGPKEVSLSSILSAALVSSLAFSFSAFESASSSWSLLSFPGLGGGGVEFLKWRVIQLLDITEGEGGSVLKTLQSRYSSTGLHQGDVEVLMVRQSSYLSL